MKHDALLNLLSVQAFKACMYKYLMRLNDGCYVLIITIIIVFIIVFI